MKRVADLTYDEERVEDVEPDYRDEMESDGLDAVMNALRQNDVLLDVETPQASSPSVRSVRAWSSSNITLSIYFNHFTFLCFNYVTQIRRTSLATLENHWKINARMRTQF